jgi:hypothetical protein
MWKSTARGSEISSPGLTTPRRPARSFGGAVQPERMES